MKSSSERPDSQLSGQLHFDRDSIRDRFDYPDLKIHFDHPQTVVLGNNSYKIGLTKVLIEVELSSLSETAEPEKTKFIIEAAEFAGGDIMEQGIPVKVISNPPRPHWPAEFLKELWKKVAVTIGNSEKNVTSGMGR